MILDASAHYWHHTLIGTDLLPLLTNYFN